jgi:hypothetical protein
MVSPHPSRQAITDSGDGIKAAMQGDGQGRLDRSFAICRLPACGGIFRVHLVTGLPARRVST